MPEAQQIDLFGPAPMLRDKPAPRPTEEPAEAPETPVAKTPRPYQGQCVDQAVEDYRHVRSTLAVMATGSGKTMTGATLIRRMPGRTLWINERDNLVSQMRDDLEQLLGHPVYIEQGPAKAPSDARVVVGSLQSMVQDNRLASFPRDHFGLIIADEAHHSVAGGYRKIFGHFSHAKLFGLTATPRRHDGKSMQLVYERQCMDYPLARAVEDGWLVPASIQFGASIDLSKIKKRIGDFTADELAENMSAEVMGGIVTEILQYGADKRGVIYLPRVDIAHVIATALNSKLSGCARAVDGRDMDRDEKRSIIKAHKRGDFLYLCNDSVVTEGHDDAGISFIGQGRPTKSLSRYTQEMGRPARPGCRVDGYFSAAERRAAIAASWKPVFTVLDFVGNAGKHSVVSAVDAMAGTMDDEETLTTAKKILKDQGGGDVQGAIDQARAMRSRERRDEAARILAVQAAKWNWRTVNPFEAFGMDGPAEVASALNRASTAQRQYLARLGVDTPDILTHADAQRLIRAAKVREKRGLADFNAVRLLSRHGIPAQQMYAATAERVKRAIEQHRGWTPPQEVISQIIGAGRQSGED